MERERERETERETRPAGRSPPTPRLARQRLSNSLFSSRDTDRQTDRHRPSLSLCQVCVCVCVCPHNSKTLVKRSRRRLNLGVRLSLSLSLPCGLSLLILKTLESECLHSHPGGRVLSEWTPLTVGGLKHSLSLEEQRRTGHETFRPLLGIRRTGGRLFCLWVLLCLPRHVPPNLTSRVPVGLV